MATLKAAVLSLLWFPDYQLHLAHGVNLLCYVEYKMHLNLIDEEDW